MLDAETVSVTVSHPPKARFPWQELKTVALFDPHGRTSRLFSRLGVRFVSVGSIADAKELPLVVGGNGVLGMSSPDLEALYDRIAAGNGDTLVLAQNDFGPGFPGGVTVNIHHGATRCFFGRGEAGRFAGMSDNDLVNWAGDGLVAGRSLNIPEVGYRAVILAGGTGGMRYAQLLERDMPGGTVRLCQLRVVDKALTEPAASAVLYELLRKMESKGTGAELHPVSFAAHMQEVFAQWSLVPAGAIQGPGEVLGGTRFARTYLTERDVQDRLASGGFVWVSVPDRAGLAALQGVLPGFETVSCSLDDVPALFAEAHPLARSGLDQDLAWLAPHPVYSQRAAKRIVPARFRLRRSDMGAVNGPGWVPVVEPGLIWARRMGRGWLVVDTLDWKEVAGISRSRFKSTSSTLPKVILDPGVNGEKGVRTLGTLLTNLGVRFEPNRAMVLEGENFAVRTSNQPLIRNRNHHFWGMFENSRISGARFSITQGAGGAHAVEVTARCRTRLKKSPVMELVLDGTVVGRCPVHRPGWRTYRFAVDIPAGEHSLEIRLTNNPKDPYNHRYLHVDKVVIRSGEP